MQSDHTSVRVVLAVLARSANRGGSRFSGVNKVDIYSFKVMRFNKKV